MLKEPRAGRTKTRLGRDIGMTAAAQWFRHQSAHLLRTIQDPRWQVVLAVAPQNALTSRVWPLHLRRVPQGAGDLGDRMRRAFAQVSRGPVLLIGADIPGVTRAHLARAFQVLGTADAVLGPATDGGYWLIGFARPGVLPPALFDGVRWSTEHACADTLATMADLRVAWAETLSDVDTVRDLPRGAAQG